MSCFLKAKGAPVKVRDGRSLKDPMRDVGAEPVFFVKRNGAEFENDPQIEVVAKDSAAEELARARVLAASAAELGDAGATIEALRAEVARLELAAGEALERAEVAERELETVTAERDALAVRVSRQAGDAAA